MDRDARDKILDPALTRREFAAVAGITFALAFGGGLSALPGRLAAATDTAARTIGGWVTIGVDDTITIAAPVAEMGQGVFTAIPMIFAEEFDADWSKVKAIFPVPIPGVYGNPRFSGILHSVASMAVTGYWDKVRLHGAQARRVLMQAAATKWGVPLAQLRTEPSVVVHPASKRRMSYGEIAAFAEVPAELPRVTHADLKKPSDYRIVGQPVARLDAPAKTDGSARYGIDVQVPDMVYATMLRAPVDKAAPERVDSSALLNIPGVLQTLQLQDAVAVVGVSVDAVFEARAVLDVSWKGGATIGYDSETALGDFAARARDLREPGLAHLRDGDATAAIDRAARTISAEYLTDYVYHAQMEPLNVTVRVNEAGDGADIWMGSQAVTVSTGVAAGMLGVTPDKVRIHQHFLGGGFGRRAYPDIVAYGVEIARQVKRPVKLIWPREQDVQGAWLRPQTAHFLQAGVDTTGRIVGLRHRIAGEATLAYSQPQRLDEIKGLDPLTLEGTETQYEIDNRLVEFLREERGAPLGAWRALGSGYNKFAIECFIDEIAQAVKTDAVELRLRLLSKHARGRGVIEAAAKMAGWGSKRTAGRALGFAYADVWNTPVAGVAEVSVDRERDTVRVHRFWNAVNPGIVVNPDIVISQSESNVIMGVSQALKERISFRNGVIEQSNFDDYPILRMSETPEIFTEVITTNDRPTGIGEIVLPVVAPAIANAVAALTGKRLRHMPFTPARVRAALGA
jgi:isoquinoline 1-oxidoreductase beta subunit